jgi:hypothetical protein
MLNVIMLSTVIVIVIMLSTVILFVIMLSAIVVSVKAPDLEIMTGSDEEKKLELEGKKKRQIIAEIFQAFINEALSLTE